jgi:predicted permease
LAARDLGTSLVTIVLLTVVSQRRFIVVLAVVTAPLAFLLALKVIHSETLRRDTSVITNASPYASRSSATAESSLRMDDTDDSFTRLTRLRALRHQQMPVIVISATGEGGLEPPPTQ